MRRRKLGGGLWELFELSLQILWKNYDRIKKFILKCIYILFGYLIWFENGLKIQTLTLKMLEKRIMWYCENIFRIEESIILFLFPMNRVSPLLSLSSTRLSQCWRDQRVHHPPYLAYWAPEWAGDLSKVTIHFTFGSTKNVKEKTFLIAHKVLKIWIYMCVFV